MQAVVFVYLLIIVRNFLFIVNKYHLIFKKIRKVTKILKIVDKSTNWYYNNQVK